MPLLPWGKRYEAAKKARELSLEEAVRHKVAHFFATLGKVEMKGVHEIVLNQVEKPLIEECLKWAGGNQIKTARVLGINRNTLRKKIAKLKIELR